MLPLNPKSYRKDFYVETIITLDDAIGFAEKWLPPVTPADKSILSAVLTGTENAYGTPFLRKYVELLRPYTTILGLGDGMNTAREADCAASGLVFFYGCLAYIIHFPNWGYHIEDIFLYNLLYILVDHYIDDIRIDPSKKDQAIAQMFILIQDPLQYKQMTLIDPILKTIALVYHRLITRCPTTKPLIIKLFQAEIEGLTIQKASTWKRDQYYDIALRKGGHTIEVLQRIVGNEDPTITEASFHIGTIMQLIDDSVDVLADRNNGIHTIATYELETKGHLDDLWIDIMNRIRHVDSRFTIFVILYTIFAVYLPDRIAIAYTSNLRDRTNPINLFDYTYGCDGSTLLVHAVLNELTAMDTLSYLRSENSTGQYSTRIK